MNADLVLLNGRVITMDEGLPRAEGVAVVGERIAMVGPAEEVRDAIGPRTEVIDLDGRTLLPGFNDAHCHLVTYGHSLQWINCRPEVTRDLGELLSRVREAAAARPSGQWVRGRGYDDTRLPPLFAITRHDLDRASPHHPVCLERICGHVLVANSRALEMAGITCDRSDPPGGAIDRTPNGEPTGVLRETARALIRDIIPPPTEQEIQASILRASRHYLAAGITSVQNAGTTAAELGAFQSLHLRGELPLRTYVMFNPEVLEPLVEAGIRTGLGDHRLRIGPLKLLMDGGVGARTAAMSQAYAGDPGNRGILWMEQDQLESLVTRAHLAGYQVGVHAIGDRAIASVLDAYERALARLPRADHRLRIEHCGLPIGGLLDRIVELGVLPVPQAIFLYEMGDCYLTNLGPERAHQLYALRRMLDAGLPIAGSSDSPVSSYKPLEGIRAAITRRSQDGQVIGPGQEITLEEALRMATRNGAYASFEEGAKGSIEPGKLADLVLLERDPFEVPPAEVSQILVDATLVGGKMVYERPLC